MSHNSSANCILHHEQLNQLLQLFHLLLHQQHNIQSTGGDDTFVSEYDFNTRFVHEIPPFLTFPLYHRGLENTTISAPDGYISTVLNNVLRHQCFQRVWQVFKVRVSRIKVFLIYGIDFHPDRSPTHRLFTLYQNIG